MTIAQTQLGVAVNCSKLSELNDVAVGKSDVGIVYVQNYLRRFGYFSPGTDPEKGRLDGSTLHALHKFQEFSRIGKRDVFDADTRNAMSRPRCGMPDFGYGLLFQTIGGWNKRTLTYAFGTGTGQAVGTAAAETAVRAAFATWEAAGMGLQFGEVGANRNPDVMIDWRPANDPDHSMVGGVLAHADFPPGFSIIANDLPLPVHFDDVEHTWQVGANIDIETVALHEIGHILGLLHEPAVTGAVMAPFYGGVLTNLHADDIGGLASLYVGNRLYIIQNNHLHRVDPANLADIEQHVGNWDNPTSMVSLRNRLYIIQNAHLHRVNPDNLADIEQHVGNWGGPTLMVSQGGRLYIIRNGHLHRVNPQNLSIEQRVSGWDNPTSMVALGNRLYIIQNSHLHRVQPNDISCIEQHVANWDGPTSMVALGNRLYIIQNGHLHRVNPANLNDIEQHVGSWDGPTSMVALGNRLYIIQNGHLHRVNPDNLADIEQHVGNWDGPTSLVALGNRLYIIQNGHLHRVNPANLADIEQHVGNWDGPVLMTV